MSIIVNNISKLNDSEVSHYMLLMSVRSLKKIPIPQLLSLT